MKQLHLNCLLGGVGLGDWRPPQAEPQNLRSLDYLTQLAHTAEKACFDALFCADLNSTAATRDGGQQIFGLEPFTTYSALAARTERIGLIVTASTTYNQPYNLARRLASLDHLSRGRAGWNIVTTLVSEVARQYGKETHPDLPTRYDRADECVDVVKKLWDSWGSDAVYVDEQGRTRVNGDANHTIDHNGPWFQVKGPLNVPRPPQGHPVLVQAGSSERGQQFAARHAEVIFTAQAERADAIAFRNGMHQLAQACGRSGDELRILPGLAIRLTDSDAQAKQLAMKQREENDDDPRKLNALSQLLGVDLLALPQDQPIPPELISTELEHSRAVLYKQRIISKRLSPRQLLHEKAHLSYIGTPEGLVDMMDDWLQSGAADGFNLMWPWLPGGLEIFASEVIPRLQRKGIFRSEYSGRMLRDHYGLKSRY